ncbi:MAG: glycosyltransferase family 2 protein [Synechococcales cyanobacterium C42_A2020_086]|nr:glycosyltransferase family 2 protein [Synechococcales cyanobacterium M58_A2018_015]MBF2072890.1 glycosyltransferase family 2 protein [Synechococcales cyanobacterium C42_A2020_086]
MSASPTVSVLMPVYNSERYVAQAIESILNQTFSDFELLIINDGSTDRSLSILQRYAAQDPRIRLFSRENQGIARTRNELLHRATGEFIAVLDSDDIALPDRLARQLQFLRQHPEVVCLGSAYQIMDSAGRVLTALPVPLDDAEIQRLALAGHASIFQSCVMMRRAVVLDIGGYNNALPPAEDLDLWLRLGEVGQLANLPEVLVQYRVHANSVSERDCAFQRQQAYEACRQAWQRRGITGQFEATEPWRPGKDRASQHRFWLQYGWWAFNSGERQTAIHYGMKAIQTLPLQPAGWTLLRCALLKPLPHPEADH